MCIGVTKCSCCQSSPTGLGMLWSSLTDHHHQWSLASVSCSRYNQAADEEAERAANIRAPFVRPDPRSRSSRLARGRLHALMEVGEAKRSEARSFDGNNRTGNPLIWSRKGHKELMYRFYWCSIRCTRSTDAIVFGSTEQISLR